jgi:murein L,D-transpeptidase YafK
LQRYLWFAVAAALIATAAIFFFELHRKPAAIVKADKILVEKAVRRLTLFSGGRKLKEYSVALGFSPIGPKQREGDGRTPEGHYTIDFHKPDSAFHRALHISYPEAADVARAAAAGLAPGGDIMIHGLPNGRSALGSIDRLDDWTAGCIAVTDFEIDEIWDAVDDGTPVEIRP